MSLRRGLRDGLRQQGRRCASEFSFLIPSFPSASTTPARGRFSTVALYARAARVGDPGSALG